MRRTGGGVIGIANKLLSAVFAFMLLNVSMYTADEEETGRGDGLTASGVYAQAEHTVAADHLPFGTKVIIYDTVYTVEDRFSGGYTDRLDIYTDDEDEAWNWGRKWIVAEVIEGVAE